MLQRENVRFRAQETPPNPLEVDYWINLNSNRYGGVIYYYNNLHELWLVIEAGGSGGSGTSNYVELKNKPKINDVELIGNITTDNLGIDLSQYSTITWVNEKLNTKVDFSYVEDTLVTKEEVNAMLELIASLELSILTKVDKEAGKGLSSNDFTTQLKNKLELFRVIDDLKSLSSEFALSANQGRILNERINDIMDTIGNVNEILTLINGR